MSSSSTQNHLSYHWWRLKIAHLVPELLVVFIGVFAAFLLSGYQAERQKEQQRIETIRAVRVELATYIANGTDAKQGFISYFSQINSDNKAQLAQGRLERLPGIIFGDFWHLESLNTLLSSGRLNDIDLQLYRSLARFNTVHHNFLTMIEGYNQYQLQYLMPRLREQPFFDGQGALVAGYEPITLYPAQLQMFSEVTVEFARQLLVVIDQKYPELKTPVPSETPTE